MTEPLKPITEQQKRNRKAFFIGGVIMLICGIFILIKVLIGNLADNYFFAYISCIGAGAFFIFIAVAGWIGDRKNKNK